MVEQREVLLVKIALLFVALNLAPALVDIFLLDADFPVEALKAKALKEVRVALSFIPSQFKEETLNFNVSIGGQ